MVSDEAEAPFCIVASAFYLIGGIDSGDDALYRKQVCFNDGDTGYVDFFIVQMFSRKRWKLLELLIDSAVLVVSVAACVLPAYGLIRYIVDDFAKLMNYHWELSWKVDEGSTNTLINQIFDSIADLIDGKLICGVGVGGFLQVILKKGVSREEVHLRLKDVFQDNEVDVWPAELV